MRYIGIAAVTFYRWTAGQVIGGRCKYYPSCSQYAIDALRSYGFWRGSALTAWRLLRCNPWSDGGVDHACDQEFFRRVGTRRTP